MRIKGKDYDRRELFRLIGGAALLIHPLLSSREGWAQNAAKKRFLVMHTANGVIQKNFWPTGDSSKYVLAGTSLEALAPHKGDLNIVKGVYVERGPYDAHAGGIVALLTGNWINNEARLPSGKFDWYTGDYIARSASIDQMFANHLKANKVKTSKPFLNLSVMPEKDRWTRYVSFDEKGKKLATEGNPYSVYDSLFAELTGCGGPGTLPANPAMKLKRESILDGILADLSAAKKHTGLNAEELEKLDSYMESIRDIEKRLASSMAPSDAVCKTLGNFSKAERTPFNKDNYPIMAELMQDLVVAAFQMDLTRVITLSYSVAGIGGVSSQWLKLNNAPIKTSHHTLTHGTSDPKDWQEKCTVIDRWHAAQFASLIGRLKGIKEGGSNLLDNSLAVWTSELGDGQNHLQTDVPFVIAGSAGDALKTGRYIVTKERRHQGLLLDLLGALGVKKNQIGRSKENPDRFLT